MHSISLTIPFSHRSSVAPLLLALLACVSAVPTEGAISFAEYFPLKAGTQWEYKPQGAPSAAPLVRTVLAQTRQLHGQTAFGLKDSRSGQEGGVYWWSAASGFQLHLQQSGESPPITGYLFDPAVRYLPATIQPGSTYNAVANYGFLDDANPVEIAGQVSVRSQVGQVESLTISGQRHDTLKVTVEETWTLQGMLWDQSTTSMWFAKGVGLVKFTAGDGQVWELSSSTLSQSASPAIVVQPQDLTVPAGATITLEVTATGSAPLRFQWKKNNAELPGQTQQKLVIQNASLADSGDYQAVITNDTGSITSRVAVVKVQAANPATQTLRIVACRLTANRKVELVFQGETGKEYFIEASSDLKAWAAARTLTAAGPTVTLSDLDTADQAARFFRIRHGSRATVATLPVPGMLYPAGTRLGGSLFGTEFGIPVGWQGGLRDKTPFMLFASDAKPGIVITEVLGFAWGREQIMADPALQGGFESDMGVLGKVAFSPVTPLKWDNDKRISGEYAGQSQAQMGVVVSCILEMVLHPSGGGITFIGFATQEKLADLKSATKAFADTAVVTPRTTNRDYMNILHGHKYRWASGGNDWYNRQEGYYPSSTSLSSWSESFAFFCSEGTFEVTKTSETYASTTNPSTGFFGISGSSTSREFGQWTIVTSPEHGDLLLLVTLSGYQIIPIRANPDGTILIGPNRMAPQGVFSCN